MDNKKGRVLQTINQFFLENDYDNSPYQLWANNLAIYLLDIYDYELISLGLEERDKDNILHIWKFKKRYHKESQLHTILRVMESIRGYYMRSIPYVQLVINDNSEELIVTGWLTPEGQEILF